MNYFIALVVILVVAVGCTYMYRDYYEAGCCTNQSVEKKDQQENRPYTHP